MRQGKLLARSGGSCFRLLLTALLVCSLAPAQAFAESAEQRTGSTEASVDDDRSPTKGDEGAASTEGVRDPSSPCDSASRQSNDLSKGDETYGVDSAEGLVAEEPIALGESADKESAPEELAESEGSLIDARSGEGVDDASALEASETKKTAVNGVTYWYHDYVQSTGSQDYAFPYGSGIYIVDTSYAETITIPQRIDGKNVVSFATKAESVDDLGWNKHLSIDASQATALRFLGTGYYVTSVVASNNAALEKIDLNYYSDFFDHASNGLLMLRAPLKLDIRSCSSLKNLDCGFHDISSLDLSQNRNLETLDVEGCDFEALDMSSNPRLKKLWCAQNSPGISVGPVVGLTSIDVTKNSALEILSCWDNHLSSLDVSGNPNLETLSCYENQLTSLDVSKNPKLGYLSCDNNEISTLDISGNAELRTLQCYSNLLTSLDVSRNRNLDYLYCYDNYIKETKALTDRYSADTEVILPQNSGVPVARLAGPIALDTMKSITMQGFAADSCDSVVVATTDGYWDALTASALAGLKKCPILLTDKGSLSPQAASEIKRLKPSTVYIAGGPAAVAKGVESSISKLAGVKFVKRLAGGIAIDTALKIYEEGKGSWGTTAVVATSYTFQDALSVSPYAYAKKAPIFLANASTHKLDSQVLSAIKKGGFSQVVIVGGTAAVSDQVEKQLAGITCKRLAGPTAYETSSAIASWCLDRGMKADNLGVATGASYYDALAGAALCGKNNAVLVLADDANRSAIRSLVAPRKELISRVYVFGGPAAVSEGTCDALAAVLKR